MLAVLAGELALVRIGRMTIRAFQVRHRLFEIAALVAIVAGGLAMRAVQRERGFVMIETCVRPNRFPAGCRVATVACGGESSMVRIFMAIGAGSERDIFVLHNALRSFGSRTMALAANQFLMQSGQGIASLLVIKPAGRLPAFQRVAASAIGS